MAIVVSVLLGFGLSAACGFRVFVPLLVISLAGKAGFLELADGFNWMASYPALIMFAVATLLEIVAYYVPVVDNFLGMVAVPVATVAGMVAMASVITEMSPLLKWALVIIAGGGASTLTHLTTTVFRGVSTGLTAGVGNGVVTTAENALSVGVSLMAIVTPLLTALLLIGLTAWLLTKRRRSRR